MTLICSASVSGDMINPSAHLLTFICSFAHCSCFRNETQRHSKQVPPNALGSLLQYFAWFSSITILYLAYACSVLGFLLSRQLFYTYMDMDYSFPASDNTNYVNMVRT